MRRSIALALALSANAAAQKTVDPHRPAATYDHVEPALPVGLHDAVLIVSKTNGWRHLEHIPHSNAVLADLARAGGARKLRHRKRRGVQ